MSGVLTDPDDIKLFRLCSLRAALFLEVKGMRRGGTSVYSIVKQEFKFKGSKQKVLDQLHAKIEQLKEERNNG
jgi:hypothetical protein